MKKITTLLMVVAMVFLSCETEPLNNDDVNGVAGKGKVKKEKVKSESSSSDDCTVNLLPNLPSIVNACTTAKGTDANNSYFDLTISDTSLVGDYAAWCVDQDATLEIECFEASVYSSYDVLPVDKFEKPDNFDLVNWLYNQNIIGQPSAGGDLFTFGDFQRAIWYLIDDSNCVQCLYLGDWDETRVFELRDLAVNNGEGYVPGAGDKLAVILIPNNDRQSIFIPYTLECEPEGGCNTAYAMETPDTNCFIDNGFNRWGWSLEITNYGKYSYDFYAGAGQCDITKGTHIGTVDVVYSTEGVEVTYNAFPGYTIDDTHTYAGTKMFPTKNGAPTVAPGQYTIQEGLGKLEEERIYVIAHAGEACVGGED